MTYIPDCEAADRRVIDGVPGTCFILCDKLSPAEQRAINRRKTTHCGQVGYRYAPELVRDYIWVADGVRNIEYGEFVGRLHGLAYQDSDREPRRVAL